tara:strand:- start:282 stop:503 length:222 start_codon:yes stop_codon:yes gene_type:complete
MRNMKVKFLSLNAFSENSLTIKQKKSILGGELENLDPNVRNLPPPDTNTDTTNGPGMGDDGDPTKNNPKLGNP